MTRKNRFLIIVILAFLVSIYFFQYFNSVAAEEKIEDGIYEIKTAINESFVFDVEESSNENGANLRLWTNENTNNQKYLIKCLGNETYSISPVHSKKNLDVQGNSKENGANVAQWQYHGGENQQWIIKKSENGYYNIISKCNGLYIDIPRSEAKNGANVHLWQKNNSKNQMFKIEKIVEKEIKGERTIEDGVYNIKTVLNEEYLFDIANGNKNNGGNLQLAKKSEEDNQKFNIQYKGNGVYNISVVSSEKYLDVQGSSKENGANVAQWQYHGGENQQWIIKKSENGYYNIISKCNGLYIDIPRSEAKDGANVHLWKENNSQNQMFKIEKEKEEQTVVIDGKKTIENGTYLIKAESNNNVLDVGKSSIEENSSIGFWTSNSTANQKFNVKYLGDGYYTIVAQHSGKGVTYSEKTSEVNVFQSENTERDNQKWIIKDIGNGTYNIISKINGKYLTQTSTKNAEISDYNNLESQKFKFVSPTPIEAKWTISDGTYMIVSALDRKYVFDIPHSSQEDGELLEIWKNGFTSNQKFYIEHIGNGYYTLKAEHSWKAIEVRGGDKRLKTSVQQGTYKNLDSQKWIIKDMGDGYYSIISKDSELALEVIGAEAKNGTKIQTNNFNYTNEQKFRICNPNSIINIDDQKYPNYLDSVEKLKRLHPNWKFEFLYTDIKFSDAIWGEARVHSRNLVETTYGGEWICSSCGTKLYDSGWYCASEKAIAYYLDPRNFLDEVNIFQFLNVNMYDNNSCTLDGIKQKINGSFLQNYAWDINNACKNQNVNPYYIIARLIQEQGWKGTQIGKGMDGGDGRTYYNPFNIGAYGNGYDEIYRNALAKAKSSGWDSMEKAIEGGIYFCKINWLDNYQNTLYQNKFDIDKQNGTNLYEHQYMQNLMGAYSEGRTLYDMYYNTGKLDSDFTFIIPIYENMDSILSQKPSNSSEIYPMNVQVTGNNVRLRKEANTDSEIIQEMPKGTILLSIQRGINSNWQKVITNNGTIGYVSGTYLKQIDDITTCNYARSVKTNDGIGCNVRYGPGLNAPKMTALPDGTRVIVIDDSSYTNIDGYNWYRIVLADGRQAFMPGNYLR